MIYKSERICEQGRVKVFWRVAVPDELSDAAERFIDSCKRMAEIDTSGIRGDKCIRASLISRGEVTSVEVSVGGRKIVSEDFCVKFS